MKIIFMGNWNLGYIVLNKLLKNGTPVSLVVTNYDLDDDDVYRNRVYNQACQYGIAVYKSYKDILSCVDQGDIAFVVAYGNEIFREDILNKIKIYNFHSSYLPYYKGRSPIQWQIKNREEAWGMTCHEVDVGIDTGKIIKRDKYAVDVQMFYESALDEYNECFAGFIFNCMTEIIEKIKSGGIIRAIDNSNLREYYKPQLSIPKDMWNRKIDEISDYLNQNRVLFFAGNRAELGILFPIILEMSRFYYVDLLVLETYFISGLEDLKEKEDLIKKNNYRVNLIKMRVDGIADVYFSSLSSVYSKVFAHLKKQEQYPYKYALVLGDRIESLGFALAAFYGKVPLVHVAGGDIAEVPYFDNSVRHCISKLAHIHLPFSAESAMTLMQMGEEESKICVIGNPSFDYDRMGLTSSKEQIEEKFHIGNEFCVVFTYHAGPLKTSRENLMEYKECLQGVLDSTAGKIIVTFPNHDPGSEEVLDYVGGLIDTDRMIVEKSLGTQKLHSIMKNFKTIIAGNSSMGLLETAYYMCPALNIGDRQTDRGRAGNVKDVKAGRKDVAKALEQLMNEYDSMIRQFEKDRTLFGDGKAAVRALDFLKQYEDVPNDVLLVKRFVRRML